MMVYEGFYDKKHGICTRMLTPWLRRVLRVSVGVLIPTGTRRTPISARAHLQLGGSLVPRSTRLWLKLPRPYSLGLRALVMVQRATWCLHPEQNPSKCPHSLTTWLSSPLYSFWGGPGGSKAWESSSREDRLAVPWVSQHCDRPGVSQVGGQSRPLMAINVRPGWVQQLPVSHRVPAINWSHSVSKLRQFWVNSSSTSISQVAKYF